MTRWTLRVWLVALPGMAASWGCAGRHEHAVRHELHAQTELYARTDAGARTAAGGPAPDASALEPTLGGYLRYALANNPRTRAAFENWQASVHRISRARRLPEPTLSFGYFLSAVETRVGPQRARLSLQQAFPWPTKLSAGADAASAQARAAQRRFDAQALMVAERVASAYWDLWQLRHTRLTHEQHLDVIRALSETVRARTITGAGTLADQQQVDLTVVRLEDSVRGMQEAERALAPRLRAAMGLEADRDLPTPDDPPDAALPVEPMGALVEATRAHPMIEAIGWLAEAREAAARAESADRLPSFTVGADWIITGEARMPGVSDSGKDAVVLGAGVRVPLWQGSYDDAVGAARAEARAQRQEQRSATDDAMAELEASLSAVRDAVRRVQLYRSTLLPQAESAYASVLGAYATGRGTVAQTLLSQRDLLELRVEQDRARADYARAWARLELVTGHEITPTADRSDTPPARSGEGT